MLRELHLQNLALIESADITFRDGLNIMTGETGAGKSVIIGSVTAALGGHADSGMIRRDQDHALIELTFDTGGDPRISDALERLGIEDAGDELLIQRKISEKRSVIRVNGETVTQKAVKELAPLLMDVYGQKEHQTLLSSASQAEVLDSFADPEIEEVKTRISELFSRLKKINEELSEDERDDRLREREADLAEYEINEIDSAGLKAGETETLREYVKKTGNVEKIRESLEKAISLCRTEVVSEAVRHLRDVSALDERLSSLEGELEETDSMLSDFTREASDYLSELSFDPQEYDNALARLDLLNHLMDKYGDSYESIMEYRDEREKLLNRFRDWESYRKELLKKRHETEEELKKACTAAHDLREKAASELSQKMSDAMKGLNFADARFRIDVTGDNKTISRSGWDSVCFMVSVNPGEDLKSVADTASGGELSRIMLALKTVMAEKEDVRALIFDEIDSGISGRTAFKVSEALGRLSSGRQIICITHLPQIAAMSDSHFLIEKRVEEGVTRTTIREIDEEGSLKELARMVGSDEETENALKNAEELRHKAFEVKERVKNGET